MSDFLLEFYKGLHERELDRRDQLNNSISTPIGLISAIFGALFYFVANLHGHPFCVPVITFLFAAFFSLFFLILTIWFLVKFYNNGTKSGFEYSGLPYAKNLNKYYIELKEHFQEEEGYNEAENQYADINFKQGLIEYYVDVVDNNAFINDQKAEYFYKAKKYLIFSIICLLVSVLPFLFIYMNKEEGVKKVSVQEFTWDDQDIQELKDKIDSLIHFNINNNGKGKGKRTNSPDSDGETKDKRAETRKTQDKKNEGRSSTEKIKK